MLSLILIVLSRLVRGIQSATDNLFCPWKGDEGAAHRFNCTPAFVGYASCWRTCFITMPPPVQTGRRRIMLLTCPFVRPFVCYQTSKHDNLKTNEPILMKIGKTRPRSNGVKNFAAVEVKVQGHTSHESNRRYIWSPGGGIIHDPFRSSSFSSF